MVTLTLSDPKDGAAGVDPARARLYIGPMGAETSTDAVEGELRRLEQRVEELARMCERLKEENRDLRERVESLSDERVRLIQRNDLARSRVESIVTRLRSMEHG